MVDATKDAEITSEHADAAENGAIAGVDGVEELKRQLDAERSARASAEQRANEASNQAVQARNYAQDSDMNLLTTAIETVKAANLNLRSQYASARAAGDFAKEAELIEMMATNSGKLLQLENGKEALAAKPKAAPQQFDPVEQLAASVSPREAAWIRAHPEFARDPQLNAKLRGTYNLLQSEQFVPCTTEFFAEMESRLGLRGSRREAEPETGDDPMSEAAKPTARRTPPPSAPVTRSGAPPGQSTRTVRLSPEEVEMAKASGLTDKQYYDNKVAMLKQEGRLH